MVLISWLRWKIGAKKNSAMSALFGYFLKVTPVEKFRREFLIDLKQLN